MTLGLIRGMCIDLWTVVKYQSQQNIFEISKLAVFGRIFSFFKTKTVIKVRLVVTSLMKTCRIGQLHVLKSLGPSVWVGNG